MSLALQTLRETIATNRESVLVVDRSMRVVASNSAADRAFSRDGASVANRRLSEVVRDISLHEAVTETLETGLAYDRNIELARDEKRKYEVRIAGLMLNAQRHAIIYFYDVTAVERLENTRQEFLSNISHELRTPLTSILAFVETLEDGAVDDPDNNRRFLEVIRRNAERMRALINDVLELSQIESGRISIDIGEVKLHRAVADVFTDLSAAASARDIDLISNVPADAVVTADADRLYQMLTNLVDNAVKFNRDGGTVTVSLERRPGRDVIAVADTGEGITGELIDRIFERFYRADRARSRDVGGTGLGLSIVKHLARLQGGEVTATSVAGSGTTFIIELPAK